MPTSEWAKQVAVWADEWHGDLIKFLARRTSSRADTHDLAQEVYLRLLRVDRTDLVRRPRSYLGISARADSLHRFIRRHGPERAVERPGRHRNHVRDHFHWRAGVLYMVSM